MSTEHTNIKVAVRVRPYNQKEKEQNQRCIVKVMDKSALLFDPDEEDDEFFFQGNKQNYRDISKRVNKKLSMDFDYVYDTGHTNEDIFAECTAPLVTSVLNGYNCSVFVYGATGAGKTFTMLGSNTSPGLTFLTMRHLFEEMELQQESRKFDVGVSYLEVYNEQVMNLLTKTGPLKLREDSYGVVVSGLVLKPIYSVDELLRLLVYGNANRTQHPTDANAESSRSHAIFQVHIRMTDRKTGTKRTVKLSMIDLAGSERAASTKGMGMRFKEGASINKSLLALGNCINKLADGLKHIPYRDSNLTRILKDSLGGNCRTLMVANVSMSSLTYEDTYNTLKYASRAKNIRTTVRQNILKSNMPKEFYVKKVNDVMAENDRLMERQKMLEAKIKQSENAPRCDLQELKPWFAKIDAVYASVIKTQEYFFGMRSRINVLQYQQTLKKNYEQIRNSLIHDEQQMLQDDFVKFTKHIESLKNQTLKTEQELPRWRTKLEDAYKDLRRLKREVRESNSKEILTLYLERKDLEVHSSKQNINNNHLSAVNSELVDNSDQLRKTLRVAIDSLQPMYERLSETHKLTPEIQTHYERLQRTIRTQTDTDTNTETSQDVDKMEEFDETPNSDSSNSAAKRKRMTYIAKEDKNIELNLDLDTFDDDDDDGTDSDGPSPSDVTQVFKKPRNLNETVALGPIGSQQLDQQHKALTKTVSRPRYQQSRLVADILSDQTVRSSGDRDKIKQAILRSKNFSTQGLQRTVAAAGLQKENLKFGANVVRKSPRALMAKVLSGTSAVPRKPMSRLAGSIGSGAKETPTVRTNRAASFRIKK